MKVLVESSLVFRSLAGRQGKLEWERNDSSMYVFTNNIY